MMDSFGVAVIGGGPAGLAAAIAASKEGADVLLVEREARLGGILKQCVHDGFGLVRYGEKLAGPEYAQRFINDLKATDVAVSLQTFVDKIEPIQEGFQLKLVSAEGMRTVTAKTILFATGCRERTARQVMIHGTRPAGVFTAGSAQYFTNILGQMPGRRCVILGSGDIGLIMARRLTLEGAKVLGVYTRGKPAGLTRNIAQCLDDFDIPLYMGKNVTRVFGHERLEAVEIVSLDGKKRPIPGTEELVECDTLILSVGLIPENELAETLGVAIDPVTRGPVCDQNGMTSVPGVFCCGNAAHVNDLVDYVSESGEAAGQAAARAAMLNAEFSMPNYASVQVDKNFSYAMPQRIDLGEPLDKLALFFRSGDERGKSRVTVRVGEKVLLQKRYSVLRPPEMERITVDLREAGLVAGNVIELAMEAV